MKTPKAPIHLSKRAKKLWREINEGYELEAEALAVLQTALENLDIADQARELLAKDGVVLDGRRHPAVGIQQHAHSAFLRAMKQLGLDVISPSDRIGRPTGS